MKRERVTAISDHAVARLAERADAGYLGADVIRKYLRDAVKRAVRDGLVEEHFIAGQRRVRVNVLGVELFAILAHDETGFTSGGEAVVTCLTPDQVRSGRGTETSAMQQK